MDKTAASAYLAFVKQAIFVWIHLTIELICQMNRFRICRLTSKPQWGSGCVTLVDRFKSHSASYFLISHPRPLFVYFCSFQTHTL